MNHIVNAAAIIFIKQLKNEFCGYTHYYSSRYMTQLANVCKYQCGYEVAVAHATKPDKMVYVVYVTAGIRKEFKSPKDAGIFMEKTIDSLFELGLL